MPGVNSVLPLIAHRTHRQDPPDWIARCRYQDRFMSPLASNPVMPHPFARWVDMSYRVRGGRGGKGLVEIWANGRFIAKVTGSIGYDEAAGPNQYFKFGIYRRLVSGVTILRLDNFRRSSSTPRFVGQRAGGPAT